MWKKNFFGLLKPIYTVELPGVAAHDSLFVLLRIAPRSCRAEPCTSAKLPDATKQTKNRALLLLATQCRLAFSVEKENNFPDLIF